MIMTSQQSAEGATYCQAYKYTAAGDWNLITKRKRAEDIELSSAESETKMIFMTFLAMAVHEIKKFRRSFDPPNGPEDDPFVRWVDVDPGQAPPNIPYLLDDLIPPPPNPNNYHDDGKNHGPSIAYCPPIWMYRTEYYASEADKYEKNFGKKFPVGKPYVLT